MHIVNLYTRDGSYVVTVRVPPWAQPPEVYLWGGRTFVRGPDGYYREACPFLIFPSEEIATPGPAANIGPAPVA